MILKYFTIATLKNTRIWMLGVLQLLVWLFLIAFIFTNGVTGTHDVLLLGISPWYGYIALASFSTLSVVLSATILYSNSSLAYCFKFSLLTPREYILDLVGACSILGVILSVIHMVATYIIFSYKFNLNLAPENVPVALLASMLAGAFMMNFGIFLALVAINYTGLQSVGLFNFVPIMLTIVLGMTQIFTKLPEYLILLSPFNEIESLLYQGYSNQSPHIQLSDITTKALPSEYLLVILAGWIILFIILNTNLLKSLKPRNIEEARPF